MGKQLKKVFFCLTCIWRLSAQLSLANRNLLEFDISVLFINSWIKLYDKFLLQAKGNTWSKFIKINPIKWALQLNKQFTTFIHFSSNDSKSYPSFACRKTNLKLIIIKQRFRGSMCLRGRTVWSALMLAKYSDQWCMNQTQKEWKLATLFMCSKALLS